MTIKPHSIAGVILNGKVRKGLASLTLQAVAMKSVSRLSVVTELSGNTLCLLGNSATSSNAGRKVNVRTVRKIAPYSKLCHLIYIT
jgi:hypothetical protein